MDDLELLLQRVDGELRRPPGKARLRREEVSALARYLRQYQRVRPWIKHSPECASRGRKERHWTGACVCGLATAMRGGPDPL